MMPEISLNVLDIAENCMRAEAKHVDISVDIDTSADKLTIVIADDGCGMDEEQLKKVVDPFYTTRTTRKVGLGIPFYKMSAESTGGTFNISSKKGVGTTVTATWVLTSIDRMPLGDMCSTIHTLIVYHPDTELTYTYTCDSRSFTLDTKEFREILGDIPFDTPEVSTYIKEYLNEHSREIDQGAIV